MKVTFDIECTPDEARAFLGLPDVVPMQDALMTQLQAKLSENIKTLDPETLAKTWVPMAMQGWGDMQKMFWGQMNALRPGTADDEAAPTAKPARGRKG
jgi:hypothetical protein